MVAAVLMPFVLTAWGKHTRVVIAAPTDKSEVPERPVVEGSVSDNSARVWVIVHPMEVPDYWVQPSVSVDPGGTWRVMIHVGRPGNDDVGKQYEILAVTDPKQALKDGTVLDGWPRARARSQIVNVTRR
jgi:hypothetical protein